MSNNKRDVWSKVEIITKVISSFLVPIVIIIVGSKITSLQREAELRESVRINYDEKFDEATMRVYRKLEEFFIAIERAGDDQSATLYQQHSAFYSGIILDLYNLKMRASARPGNVMTVRQLEEVTKNILQLEELHKLGLKSATIKVLRESFISSFRAILATELLKKRGEM